MADNPGTAPPLEPTSVKGASAEDPPTTTLAHDPANDPPIEVDSGLSDGASDLESISNYTASLTSSVVEYPVEHGRRYHAYRAGRYSRPNDELEDERLLLLHQIMTLAIGGLYLAPFDKDKIHRILDIGTGTGVWAISIGEAFPNATVLGNDLSADMPTYVPSNVKFEVDDVESPWLHEAKFDWIFSRYMAVSILDWPKLVGNIYENLEPGGWCEFQDFDLQYYSDDGSLKPKDPLLDWVTMLCDAARSLNRDPCPGSKLEGWVKGAGFKNVVHKRYKIPIGPWAKDPTLKKIGLYNYMQVNGGLEGLSLRLFTNVLKWKEEEILVFLAKVRKDLQDPTIHGQFDFHVVYGQKPE